MSVVLDSVLTTETSAPNAPHQTSSVFLEATHESRLRAFEVHRVSSKRPLRVRDPEEGVVLGEAEETSLTLKRCH